jgi:hypothetical protein
LRRADAFCFVKEALNPLLENPSICFVNGTPTTFLQRVAVDLAVLGVEQELRVGLLRERAAAVLRDRASEELKHFEPLQAVVAFAKGNIYPRKGRPPLLSDQRLAELKRAIGSGPVRRERLNCEAQQVYMDWRTAARTRATYDLLGIPDFLDSLPLELGAECRTRPPPDDDGELHLLRTGRPPRPVLNSADSRRRVETLRPILEFYGERVGALDEVHFYRDVFGSFLLVTLVIWVGFDGDFEYSLVMPEVGGLYRDDRRGADLVTKRGFPNGDVYATVLSRAPKKYLHVADGSHLHLPVRALLNQRDAGSVVIQLEPGASAASPLGILGPMMQRYAKKHPLGTNGGRSLWLDAAGTVREAARSVCGDSIAVRRAFRMCGLQPGCAVDGVFIGEEVPSRRAPRITSGLLALNYKLRRRSADAVEAPELRDIGPRSRAGRDRAQAAEIAIVGASLAGGKGAPCD